MKEYEVTFKFISKMKCQEDKQLEGARQVLLQQMSHIYGVQGHLNNFIKIEEIK
jgi:hypothetical protein